MAKRHPDRDVAKILFVNADLSQQQIAHELDVSEQTVSKWKKEDRWDEEKQVTTVTPMQLVKGLYEQCNDIMADAKKAQKRLSTKDGDTIIKLTKAAVLLSNRLDPATLMEAFVKLNNHIVVVNPELAKQLLPYEKELIQSMLTKA